MTLMISATKKKTIITSAQAAYSSYLLLDLCSNHYYANRQKSFRINKKTDSFKDFVVQCIQKAGGAQEMTQAFTLNNKKYTLKLTLINGDWQVNIEGQVGIKKLTIKPLNETTPEEFIYLVQQHPLTITQDNSGDYKFATQIKTNGKVVTIGGKDKAGQGKVDLYQLHINNLYAMVKNLSSSNPNLHMLIAMTTGSGKSYTQALWFLIMHLADYSCVFTAPKDNLVTQLKADFCKLLPDEVTKDLQENAAPGHKKPFYSVTTYSKLLMKDWSTLFDNNDKAIYSDLFFSFDEEHEAAETELFKKRIQVLTQHHAALFLSATPSKVAYQLCGGKPLITLSKKDKEKLGIAKSAVSVKIQAEPAKMVGKTRLDRLILSFVDAIEKHRVSAAHTYLNSSETAVSFRAEHDPFYVKVTDNSPESLRRLVRWNMHCPIGDKALILTSNHDQMVNLSTALHAGERYAYKRGNRVSRQNVYNFFQLGPNLDKLSFDEQSEQRRHLRRDYFAHYIKDKAKQTNQAEIDAFINKHVSLEGTNEFLTFRIYHGVIENTLIFLTGFDSARLDHDRFHDLNGLMQLVTEKINALKYNGVLSSSLIEQQIVAQLRQDKIPLSIAQKIAEMMVQVIKKLDEDSVSLKPEDKQAIIDNWQLDKECHQICAGLLFRDNSFVERFKTVFLMKGMGKTATPVQDNKPFFKLNEHADTLRDYKPAKEAPLKHKLSTLEALDDTTQQYHYTADYGDNELTPAVVDTLFRKRLIGAYITSERSTGFNDPDLQHTALLLDTHDDLNNPDKITQSAGRNRGLRPAQQPYFALIQDENVQAAFDPALLDKANYFPDLFTARKKHHKATVKRLGKLMAAEIQAWIETALTPYGEINPNALQEKCRDIMLTEFDKIYKANGHNFKKAQKEFTGILQDTYYALYASAKTLNKSYELAFSARVIAFILNLITGIWYSSVTRSSAKAFKKACKELTIQSPELKPELTYMHLVQNYPYRNLMKHAIGAKRIADVMADEAEKTYEYIKDHPAWFLNQATRQQLNEVFKTLIAPDVMKFFGSFDQQVALLTHIEQQADWTALIFKYRQGLFADNPQQKQAAFAEMIQEVPAIQQYLQQQKLQCSMANIEASEQFTLTAPALLENAELQAVTGFIKANLHHALIILDPRLVHFFMQHKEDLQFSPALLTVLQQMRLEPDILLTFLTDALPPNLQQQIPVVLSNAEREAQLARFKLQLIPLLLGTYATLTEENKQFINRGIKTLLAPDLVKSLGTFKQQVEILELIDQADWSALLFQFKTELMTATEEKQIAIFHQMLQATPSIKAYLDLHHITTSPAAADAAALFWQTAPSAFEQIQLQTRQQFVRDHLHHGLLQLHPRQAQFFMQHKEKLQFTEDMLNDLQMLLVDPKAVLDALTAALPESLRADIPKAMSAEEKNKKTAKLDELLDDLQDKPEEYLDSDKVRKTLSKSLGRYIESPSYQKIFKKMLTPLTKQHLQTILQALYPEDKDNAEKLKLILDYKADLDKGLPYWQLFDKYGKFTKVDFEKSDLYRIQTWLKDIVEEVIDSVCYYQSMDSKGESMGYPKSPKLKFTSQNQQHHIWTLHDTKDQSVLTFIARKTQFIMASIDAFSPLNKIDSTKDRYVQQALKSTAEHVVAESKKAMQGKKPAAKLGSQRQHEQRSAQLSHTFGALFAKTNSLTEREIRSKDTKTTSAVEKMKDQLKSPKK